MRTYNQSVIPLIEMAYPKLTPLEKRIANYFVGEVNDTDLSSKVVSQRLYVSESSLSRFAKKVGFSGYREFIYAYQYSHQTVKDLDTLTRDVLNFYQKILEKSYSLIDNEQMIRIAKMLDEYKRIYVYGIASSGVVANEFKLRFMRLGLDVDDLVDAHSIRMNVTRINEQSLVFGISVSGRTKEKGTKTILLSAYHIHKYRNFYDELILLSGLKNLAVSDKISPQIPALIMIDILYTHYLHYNQYYKREKLNMTLEHIDYELEK